MSRRHVQFPCEGRMLSGTLDSGAASGSTGLLIVSGGNEIRSGSWGGQARLAARLAEQGVPVFRFDRRGIGDSEGENTGFRNSAPDIAAAVAAFRAAAPHLRRIVGFGNCDAASALALHNGQCGFDALVLANPWTIEDSDGEVHAPAALRQRYLERLMNPAAVLRLLTGKVDLRRLWRGLRASSTAPAVSALAQEMMEKLARFSGPVTILLATGDRVAQVFVSQWQKTDPRIAEHPGSSHSFSDPEGQEWLFDRLQEATAVRH